MRICICGKNRKGAVERAEKVYGVSSINIDFPSMENNEYRLFYYAAETFKHCSNKTVIFDGGVFDSIKDYIDQGWKDLQEQVILSTIINIDKFVIIKDGMDKYVIDSVEFFQNMYPEKFVVVDTEDEMVIV